jgi:D-inositol-3-phosphate glycosyltransferase
MKIAIVSEHASPLAAIGGVDAGGQNVHVAALAAALANRGHEIVVYTRRDSRSLREREPLCDGVVVEHLDAGPPREVAKDDLPAYLPEMRDELISRLPAFGPAVLHAHFWMSGLIAAAAARHHDLPHVQTFHALGAVKRRHQGDADTSPRHRLKDEARLARTATQLTASCSDELRELVAMGAPRSRIEVVPSGVDLDLFSAAGPAAERGSRPRVLTIGRLVARKGVDDAIRAVAELPDVELIVAGGPGRGELDDDTEARRLSGLAAELGVADRVELLGQVSRSDLPALIRSADVVACLPWYEPFGIVPLEAMACGVPVVGTGVGGLLDTVLDDVTGLLVPPHRPDAAAAAIGALLHDARRRRGMGRAGARRARSYGWPQVAAATERVYVRATCTHESRSTDYAQKEVVG